VELADERCRIGIRQRVLGGYLFHAPGGPAPAAAIAPHQVRAAFEALRTDAEARLAALGAEPELEAALELFLSVYEPLFGVIQPAARRGRSALERFLRSHLPGASPASLLTGVQSMASERRRLAADPAQYLALFGDEAAVWDLAEPTYRERGLTAAPAAATPAVAPAASFPGLSPDLRAEGELLLAVARACAAVGEDDDWLYARLQTAVRRAILALGRRLGPTLDAPDDLFYWPLPEVRAAAAGKPPPDPRALARAGRAWVEEARRDPPPAAVQPGAVLRGSGTGGRVLGRIHHHDRAHPVTDLPEAVLVAHTLLPTELPLLRAAALVTDTGGPLDHVAAQARERGLPAVVGAAGASQLAEGALVLVDADQGLVVRL
jgi:pyruvate,water dikinase